MILALVLWAQIMTMPARGYTTADPLSEERLGLAASSGRYAIVLAQPCSIGELQNVVFWGAPYETNQTWLVVAPVGDDGTPITSVMGEDGQAVNQTCGGYVVRKMDNLPCFGGAFCDVRYELGRD